MEDEMESRGEMISGIGIENSINKEVEDAIRELKSIEPQSRMGYHQNS